MENGSRLVFVLLLVCSVFTTPLLVFSASPAASATLLSVDFTGKTLPSGWNLQGSAEFVGGLNASTGVGGVEIVNNVANVEGAVVYGAPFTTLDIIIELSGMYAPGPSGNTEGVGFYSGGPTADSSNQDFASPNGYFAEYKAGAAWNAHPFLFYNAHVLSSGGTLPSNDPTYLYTETVITSSTISMNALTRTDSPWMTEPSVNITNLLTYDGKIDNSHSTLYVGGWSGSVTLYEYLYWLRVVTYSGPVPEYPTFFLPLLASLTLTVLAVRYRRHSHLQKSTE
jgi:hypothetical protein